MCELMIGLRCTKDEKEIIIKNPKEKRVPMSRYIKESALNDRIPALVAYDIGNIRRITKEINMMKDKHPEIDFTGIEMEIINLWQN